MEPPPLTPLCGRYAGGGAERRWPCEAAAREAPRRRASRRGEGPPQWAAACPAAGRPVCWGSNSDGQSIPPAGDDTYIAIAAGSFRAQHAKA